MVASASDMPRPRSPHADSVGSPEDSDRWPVVIEKFVGRAADFHEREVPEDSTARLWWFETAVDALVLGSRQDRRIVDEEACRFRGIDIVRRRSGGGLVLLSASGTLWLDVVVPARHPVWGNDVTSSADWLGECWIRALEVSGVSSLVQHRGRMERSEISDLVCFAGRGPGEVFLSTGAKVVGISQRRTRHHARFQCAVSLVWEPGRLLELLASSPVDPGAFEAALERAGSTLVNESDSFDRTRLISTMTDLLTMELALPIRDR